MITRQLSKPMRLSLLTRISKGVWSAVGAEDKTNIFGIIQLRLRWITQTEINFSFSWAIRGLVNFIIILAYARTTARYLPILYTLTLFWAGERIIYPKYTEKLTWRSTKYPAPWMDSKSRRLPLRKFNDIALDSCKLGSNWESAFIGSQKLWSQSLKPINLTARLSLRFGCSSFSSRENCMMIF